VAPLIGLALDAPFIFYLFFLSTKQKEEKTSSKELNKRPGRGNPRKRIPFQNR
jgi:hypothetical protein